MSDSSSQASPVDSVLSVSNATPATPRTALVLGGKGLLGQSLMAQLAAEGWEAHSLGRETCNLLSPNELYPHVERLNPQVIFNTVAWTQVDAAEDDPKGALSINRGLPALLGSLVKGSSTQLVHFSTDFVFNGRKQGAYTEEDKTDPQSVYGSTKLAGELALLELGLSHCCIIRTAWLFGSGRKNFVSTILKLAAERDTIRVVHDQYGSPTYTPDLAQASVLLATRGANGIYHVANTGQASWCEFAAEAVRQASLPCTVQGIPSSEWPQQATRPKFSVLSTEKYTALAGTPLRPWHQALRDYVYTSILTNNV